MPATAAAALVAIHAGQVLQGRNARMYALGILLTASSGLLLLRCLREPRRIGPWLVYAACAAAFLYVHYYAAFTLAAQGLFALADAMGRRSDARRLAATVRGLSAAVLVVLVLYLPWLPAMREQSQRLGEVPAAAASGLDLVPLWALGFRPPAGLAPLAVIGVLALLGWAAAHGRAARFFLLQAALPWMVGVSWSLISGRAVLRDRYLVFAQFSLLCLIATVLAARRPGAWRAAGVAAAIALAGFGLSREARRLYPDEPHALVKATRFLGREAGPADVVLTDSPRTLNKVVYYAAHQGLSGIRVRCALDLIDQEQEDRTHLAVLRQDDLLAGTPLPGREASRLWRVITRPLAERQVSGWAPVWERSFSGGERSSVTLVRLEPAADATRRER